MKEILVARKALAETLTSSAVAGSVETYGRPGGDDVGIQLPQDGVPPLLVTPTTSRSGVQGVLHGEALTQELGVPGDLDRDAGRRQSLDQPG
jgi:hypothetical protein